MDKFLLDNVPFLYALKDNLIEDNDNTQFFQYCLRHYEHTSSQSFQDLWVTYEVKKHQEYRTRYFVEFGAHDGKDGSNTYLIQQQYPTWNGLLIEPNPYTYDLLVANRKEKNSRVKFDNRLVMHVNGEEVTFLVTKNEHQLSTVESYRNSDYNAEKRQLNTELVTVETVTLKTILDEKNAPVNIDYISVDTEGTEALLLAKFFQENDKYTVDMFTIEHNYNESREVIFNLMTNNGYVRKFPEISRWDDFYIRKELDD